MSGNDPFSGSTGAGNFPKVEDLEGLLVLIRPTKLEQVPDRFSKAVPKPMKDRITADVVVFLAEGGTETYEDMYLSQAGIVPTCKKTLRRNDPSKPFVLGRIGMGPTDDSKKKGWDTQEKLKQAISEWVARGGKGDKPTFWWGLMPLTEEDANLARPVALALLSDNDPFAGGE